MANKKQKIKLSQKLKQGIEVNSAQELTFKIGGTFFLILSLIMAVNIYKNMSVADGKANSGQSEQQVLGAFDDRRSENSAKTPEEPKENTYTIEKGDTLFNIAQKHNLNWVVIATLNSLEAPYDLRPGAVLKLPANQ
jgi:LysM repeat protein